MKQHDLWKFGVVLMHDVKDMGFIVNQRISNLSYRELSRVYGFKTTFPKCHIYCGGPVSVDRATILHSADYKNSNTNSITAQASITFNEEIVRDISQGRGPRQWKVMLGHAEWQPGQLEAELIRSGGWIEMGWTDQVWGDHKRKDKMWRRMIDLKGQQQGKQFMNELWGEENADSN
jgi:putative transcriptional regulator